MTTWLFDGSTGPEVFTACRDIGFGKLGSCPATAPALRPRPEGVSVQPSTQQSLDVLPAPSLAAASSQAVGAWYWAALALMAVLACVFFLLWWRSRYQPGRHHDTHHSGSLPRVVPSNGGNAFVLPSAGLDTLIGGLISIYDLSDSPGVALQAQKTLASVGITPIFPERGTPFDINQHAGGGAASTQEPALYWHISSVTRVGWRNEQEILRPAEVIVYQEGDSP